MDDAERIPIDIGYDEVAPAQPTDRRITVREDGTIVIDLLASRPCVPEPTMEPEIVVCATAPADGRLRPLPPPETRSPMDVLADALSARIGPVEINPALRPEGAVGIGLRIRF